MKKWKSFMVVFKKVYLNMFLLQCHTLPIFDFAVPCIVEY